jgi:hypothetical protein
MTTQALPTSAGWQWLKEGAKLTVKNPVLVLWVLFTHLLFGAVVVSAWYAYGLGMLLGEILSESGLGLTTIITLLVVCCFSALCALFLPFLFMAIISYIVIATPSYPYPYGHGTIISADNSGILFGMCFFSGLCAFFLPLLFMATMSIYRGVARGKVASFAMYFAPWSSFPLWNELRPLFKLSQLCALVSVLAAAIVYAAIFLGSKLYGGWDWTGVFYGYLAESLTVTIIFIPFLAAFSFPTLLAAFQEWDVTKAIKHGFFTSLKNWRALFVNVALWIMLIIMHVIAFNAAFTAVVESKHGDIYLLGTLLVLFSAESVFVLAIFLANGYRCYAALFPED